MNHRSIFWMRIVRVLLVALFVLPVFATFYVSTVNAEISGAIYTSPNFGYAISWQSPWYATLDETDDSGFDVLGLADDQAMIYFSGGHSNAPTPARVIEGYASQFETADDWANFRQLDATECPVEIPANSAAACYMGDQTFSDGSQATVGVLLQAWDLGNGLDLLLEGYAEEPVFASYLPKWQQFGIYPPGTAVPTPAAGSCDSLVENGISFCFDPALSERDRSDITEAIRLGQDLIARYFDTSDLSGVRVNGFAAVSSDGPESLATTLNRSIVVYAGSSIWQSLAPIERIQTLVHELFHVYQNVMTEESSAIVPLWFTEGVAEAVGYLAAAQLGVTDQNEFYEMAGYSLSEFPAPEPLTELGSGGSMSADDYPLAYIAIQYLLGSRGLSVSALGDVYRELASGADFEQAFQTVFGETLDQFAADFESWRPTFAQVTELPDDFWPIHGNPRPATIALQSAPADTERDQQIVVVGKTQPLAACEANLQLGQNDLQRSTYANGEGEVFWLMTIPADAPTGLATLELSCGAAPVSTTLAIT